MVRYKGHGRRGRESVYRTEKELTAKYESEFEAAAGMPPQKAARNVEHDPIVFADRRCLVRSVGVPVRTCRRYGCSIHPARHDRCE